MERGIRQEEAAAAGHTWQALTEGKGLPEQDRGEPQVARTEIPQPSLELGFTPWRRRWPRRAAGGLGHGCSQESILVLGCREGARYLPAGAPSGQTSPLLPRPRHPPLLPRGDMREGRRLAEGKLRHGGGCLSPFHELGRGGSGIPSHSSSGAPGAGGTTRLLCCLMSTQCSESPHRLRRMAICPWEQGHPGSFPRARAGGVGCPQLRAAFHPLPGRGSLSVTCCPPGRRPRARGQGRCARRGRSARTSSGWRGGSETPEAASCPTHPTASSSAQGGHSWDGPWQSPSPETAAPRTFPAKLSIAFSCCSQREEPGSGRWAVWVSLEHTRPAACACPGTHVYCASTCVRAGAGVSVERRTETSLCTSERALHARETAASLLLQRCSACAA